MNILIRTEGEGSYFLSLNEDKTIEDVKKMIFKDRHDKAIDLLFKKSNNSVKIMNESEIITKKVDLILTKNNAMWDLT